MSNLVKALLIINAKKGWTDAARKKAALTRKAKAKVKSKTSPSKSALGKSPSSQELFKKIKALSAKQTKLFSKGKDKEAKALGKDIKSLTSARNKALKKPKAPPKWMTEGKKMKPKKKGQAVSDRLKAKYPTKSTRPLLPEVDQKQLRLEKMAESWESKAM